jgi:glutamate racemase
MIGIFDSGYGGLTIFKEILKKLPDYDYIYLGDNFRAPYGNRSQEVIYKFTHQAVEYLFEMGCKLVILACNTASADTLAKLQKNYLPEKYPDRRILGVIRSMAEAAVKISQNKTIGVVGTRATIESKTFIKELKKQDSKVKVFQRACPLLAPLIEEEWLKKPETRMILKKYIRPLKSYQIDTLILGCTHYILLLDDFRRIMGKNIQVPHPGKIVAQSLVNYLERHPELADKLSENKKVAYLTTDCPERFKKEALVFLGREIKVKKVDIDNS